VAVSLIAFVEPNRGHSHQILTGERQKMYQVRQENLPFVGSSHAFVGAEQGNTSVSVFLFPRKPGSGPGPHRHSYDEIQFIMTRSSSSLKVGGCGQQAARPSRAAQDIFVIKAGEIHSFKAVGDSPLVPLDVHLSPASSRRTYGPVGCNAPGDHRPRQTQAVFVSWRNIVMILITPGGFSEHNLETSCQARQVRDIHRGVTM
jgi:quercetin dioxygenase-like cupin family protein